MGADAVIAFYGIRYVLADAELDAVEQNVDSRQIAARRVRLQTYFGRKTDGEPYFLLIGSRLGILGIEHQTELALEAVTLERIMRDTPVKLQEAGLRGEARLYLQLEAQY